MSHDFRRKLSCRLPAPQRCLQQFPPCRPTMSRHESDNNEARYRHTVMEAMGSSFGALALIMTNRVARPDQLATQAKALAISASVTPTLFPAGSEGGDALPLIWQEQDKVAEAAQRAVDATAALAAAAEAGDSAALKQSVSRQPANPAKAATSATKLRTIKAIANVVARYNSAASDADYDNNAETLRSPCVSLFRWRQA